MASNNSLTTLANVKTHLGVSTNTDDGKLAAMIEIATDILEEETQRKLKARNYNGFGTDFDHATNKTVDSEDYMYVDGDDVCKDKNGYNVIYLPQWPVLKTQDSANALTFALDALSDRDSGGDTWNTTDYVEGDDFIVDYKKGIIRFLGMKPSNGIKRFRVTCTAGYHQETEPFVPASLEYICKELTNSLYDDKENVKSESIGTWSRQYYSPTENTGMSKKVTELNHLIAKYKKITL